MSDPMKNTDVNTYYASLGQLTDKFPPGVSPTSVEHAIDAHLALILRMFGKKGLQDAGVQAMVRGLSATRELLSDDIPERPMSENGSDATKHCVCRGSPLMLSFGLG